MATSQSPDPAGRRSERPGLIERRRQKILAEVERNRRGEYKVPTWVLAVILVVIVGAWLALIFLS